MFSPDDLGELQEARAGPSESDLTMPMIEGSPTALPSSLEDPSLDNVDREVFEMYYCKVAPCPRKHAHDWSSCPYLHEGETKARRRCPRKYAYTSIACPSMKQVGMCPQGDACPFAHNDFEYWLHHTRYHTCLCNKGERCDRKFCFFAHSRGELRTPAERPRLPPGSAAAAAALRQGQGASAGAAGARGASRGSSGASRQGAASKPCSRAAWRLSLGGSSGAFGGGSFNGSGFGGSGFPSSSPSGCLGGSFGSGSASGLSSSSGASGFLDGSSFSSASGSLGYALEQLQASAAAAAAAAAAASGSFGGSSSDLRVGSLGEAASGFSSFTPQGSVQATPMMMDPQGSTGWGSHQQLPLPCGEASLLQPRTPPSQPGGVEFLGAASYAMPVSPFELAQPVVPAAPPVAASGPEGGTSRALMAAIAGQLASGHMDAATATTLLAQLLPPQALMQLSTELELQAMPASGGAAAAAAAAQSLAAAAAAAAAVAPLAPPAGAAAPSAWLAAGVNSQLGCAGNAAGSAVALQQALPQLG